MTDDELLKGYLPWLRKVAGNLLGQDDAGFPDLLQEGYIAMWRALKSYDAKKGVPFDYWLKLKASRRMRGILCGTNKYTAHNGVPGQKSADDIPVGESYLLDVIAAPDLLEQMDIAYHHGEIAQAIDSLTPQQKKYVIARFWLGLSGNEMRQLGVFNYDPSGLWNRKGSGARWKLEKELAHLR